MYNICTDFICLKIDMNIGINFTWMTGTLVAIWISWSLGYLLVIMPIIMLKYRLSSISTDGAIDLVGAFGCIIHFFRLDAQFKPILSIVLLCGVSRSVDR